MKRHLISLILILILFSAECFAVDSIQDINTLLNNRIDSIHNYFQQKPFLLKILKERPEVSYVDKPNFTGLYTPNIGPTGIIKIGPNGIEDPRVAYHEYIHALINKIYPQLSNHKTYQAEAIEEGIPQYFACSFSDNPNFNWGEEKRTLENKLTYPQDIKFDAYKDSYILCGALWGLRETIKNPLVADFLIYQALYYKPKNFSEMLVSILKANDQFYGNHDNNISNDAWSQKISNAFSEHGITIDTSESIYAAKLTGKSDKITFKAGENITLWAKFQNTGPATWYNSPAVARSENDPQDKREVWLSKIYEKIVYGYTNPSVKSIKIAKLVEEKVTLNEIGTFKLTIKAPIKKGTYIYTFTPQALLVGEDNSPFSPQSYNMNTKVTWEITVI